jgi:Serine phosphatase RsbU, regulator of sigma subunit
MSLRDDKGELMGLVSTTRDITARKKAEEQLAKYAEELREKNAQLEADLETARELQNALLPQQFHGSPVPLCQRRVRCDFTISFVLPQRWAAIFSKSFSSPTPRRECLFAT